MRKSILVTLIVVAAFSAALAQQGGIPAPETEQDFARLAVAPKQINGIGRLVLNIVDENGNPVKDVYAHLESNRTDGFLCESWSSTNAIGFAALPPIHMGNLKLKLKAKGYQKQEIVVPLESLSQPVRVVLRKK